MAQHDDERMKASRKGAPTGTAHERLARKPQEEFVGAHAPGFAGGEHDAGRTARRHDKPLDLRS
jgi:hypothetical protein